METLTVEIAVEPVYNALNSLSLLNEIERRPALEAWVIETAQALTETQERNNVLAWTFFRNALVIEGGWQDFSTYLDDLAAQPANELRDRALSLFTTNPAEQARLLDDPEAFAERMQPQDGFDRTLISEAHALFQRPDELRGRLVSHLTELWELYLAPEWARVSAALHNETRAMQNNRLRGHILPAGVMSIEASLHALVAPEAWADPSVLSTATGRVVYANSAHTGRYVTWLHTGTTLRIFFNALRNFPAIMRTTPVSRAELVARLSALADETRLQVLELFTQRDALTAQEIMVSLDLTQSSASRQLKSLAPFLHESRGKGPNKIYRLSPAQVELTFHSARAQLAGAEPLLAFEHARLEQPEVLRRYMNVHGKLTMLPLRRDDRKAALELVVSAFEPDRTYTEKEVNTLIAEQLAFDDFVTMRRELCNYKLLRREPDGSRYWRGASAE